MPIYETDIYLLIVVNKDLDNLPKEGFRQANVGF